MATAARRNSGAYDTLYTNVVEKWLNDNNAEDLVFLNTPTLAMFNAAKELAPLPADLTVRILESRGSGVDSFSYYDNVSTEPTKGTQAARFEVANYSAPIALSGQEELEFTSPQAIADHVSLVMQKQLNEISERLAVDIFKGSVSNTKNINGTEQLLPDYTHTDDTGTTATNVNQAILKRFQMKQAANSYGGITRQPWASDDVPGTYWEGNAIDLGLTGSGPFGWTAGVPNDVVKRMHEGYALGSYGIDTPNVVVSSFEPYQDYENGLSGFQQIHRTGGALLDGNITFDNIKFKNATWFWDDFCKTYNQIANGTAGDNDIYMFNTKYMHFRVDSRWNFHITEPRTTTSQIAAVRHILWRGQLVCRNPRTQVRLFSYSA